MLCIRTHVLHDHRFITINSILYVSRKWNEITTDYILGVRVEISLQLNCINNNEKDPCCAQQGEFMHQHKIINKEKKDLKKGMGSGN